MGVLSAVLSTSAPCVGLGAALRRKTTIKVTNFSQSLGDRRPQDISFCFLPLPFPSLISSFLLPFFSLSFLETSHTNLKCDRENGLGNHYGLDVDEKTLTAGESGQF